MTKPIEILLFEFFDAEIKAAKSKNPLYGIQLLDTLRDEIDHTVGKILGIGEVTSSPAPGPDGLIKEFDAFTMLVCGARVVGEDKTKGKEALQAVYEIQMAVTELLFEFPNLKNRGCNVQVLRQARSSQAPDAEDYTVANVPIVVNPTGSINFERINL